MTEVRSIEATGPDIETAIANGLAELKLPREAVAVDILDEGSRGILGIGARRARVRIVVREPDEEDEDYAESGLPAGGATPTAAPPETRAFEAAVEEADEDADEADEAVIATAEFGGEDDAKAGAAALEELLEKMEVRAKVHVHRAEPSNDGEATPWVLEIRGRDLGILIGRRGETLASLQYITRLIASRDLQHRVNFIVDVEGYKARRATQLRKLAVRMAEQAIRRGRTVALEPMPPYERRIIHMTLRDNDSVRTESVGEGDRRKVTIIPEKPSRDR
ncbi:MAG: hypothetical protein Kow00120_00880 [Anaerolineae bacterium]